MWTAKNRGRYDRSKLRYPSDLTDDEWAHVAPLIAPAKRGGNRRHVDVREVMNGTMCVLSTGCQWRAIPKDLPPRSTLFDYLDLWSWDGTLDRIHHALYAECRERGEREASDQSRRCRLKSLMTPDTIYLEDGRQLRMLKRHLRTAHGMSPDQYRQGWNVPPSYPMVAPNYAKQRGKLAKVIGLGTAPRRKRAKA